MHCIASSKSRRKRPTQNWNWRAGANRRLKLPKNPHRGTTLDRFLEQEGPLGEFQAQAIKEVIAWQLAEAMKDRKVSKTRLAELMHTSRTQINRILDPNDGNVTIETLQRAAALVGRRVQVQLV